MTGSAYATDPTNCILINDKSTQKLCRIRAGHGAQQVDATPHKSLPEHGMQAVHRTDRSDQAIQQFTGDLLL